MTVRDGDGSVVQFLYGDDGIDVLKVQYLHDNQFKTVIDNQKVFFIIYPDIFLRIMFYLIINPYKIKTSISLGVHSLHCFNFNPNKFNFILDI